MAAILLVEDVPFVRMMLREFLEFGGHDVIECDGGDKARRLLGEKHFDLVVTDIRMKDGDGLTLIEQVRSSDAKTPIIALTAGDPQMPQSTSSALAKRAGASRVLMKPITKTEILDAVAEVMTVHAQNGQPSMAGDRSR